MQESPPVTPTSTTPVVCAPASPPPVPSTLYDRSPKNQRSTLTKRKSTPNLRGGLQNSGSLSTPIPIPASKSSVANQQSNLWAPLTSSSNTCFAPPKERARSGSLSGLELPLPARTGRPYGHKPKQHPPKTPKVLSKPLGVLILEPPTEVMVWIKIVVMHHPSVVLTHHVVSNSIADFFRRAKAAEGDTEP